MDTEELEQKFKKWRNLKFYFPYKDLSSQPNWQVAVLTCMDCRITTEVFGVEDPGEAVIIRNAGAILTPDTLRSIILAISKLNVRIIVVMGHTNCGDQMNSKEMDTLLNDIYEKSKIPPEEILQILGAQNASEAFKGFSNIHNQVLRTVHGLQQHPLISAFNVQVLGYIYDVHSGDINYIQ